MHQLFYLQQNGKYVVFHWYDIRGNGDYRDIGADLLQICDTEAEAVDYVVTHADVPESYYKEQFEN